MTEKRGLTPFFPFAMIREETKKWADVIRTVGIKLQ
jgi:hypothetical protein